MKMTKNTLLVTIALLFTSPGFAELSIESDVIYGHKDGMALVYTVLQPENANGAAIVFMVSGGWFSRWSPPQRYARQFEDMLDAGFTVIPVHHGSAPRYRVPEAYADVSRAIRHIKLHAQQLGIDPDRLCFTVGSAGGPLSLMLGLCSDPAISFDMYEVIRRGDAVSAVVSFYPPVHLRLFTVPHDRFPALDFEQSKAAAISPILHADPSDPPTLLIHGDADTLVDISNSIDMQAEFEKQHITSEFITIPGAGHGFRGEDSTQAAAVRLAWFRKYLL